MAQFPLGDLACKVHTLPCTHSSTLVEALWDIGEAILTLVILTHQVQHTADFLAPGPGINPLAPLFEHLPHHRLSTFWQADGQDQL